MSGPPNETESTAPLLEPTLTGAMTEQYSPGEEDDSAWPAIVNPETQWAARPTPTLPIHALPKPIRAWVQDAAERLGSAPEAVAVPALAGAGALIGNTLRIHPKANDKSWAETPNLYGLVIGGPTTMKSPALRAGLALLDHIKKDGISGHRATKADREASKVSATAGIKRLETSIGSTESETKLAEYEQALASEYRKLEASQAEPRTLVINDITVEQAGVLLSRPENRSGMLIKRQEISGLFSQMKRAGHEGDRAFYLEAYDGIDSFITERVTRARTQVDVMTLSMIGTIQPTEIDPTIRDVLGRKKDDGLLQRFQLTVWLDRLDRGLGADREQDHAAFHEALEAHDSMNKRTQQREADFPSDAFEGISLGLDAQSDFDAWRQTLLARACEAEQAGRAAFAAHLGKAHATAMRLALITFELERSDTSTHVSRDQLLRACELTDYFLANAETTYRTHLPVEAGLLLEVWEDIKAGAIYDGQAFREAYRDTAIPTKVSDARALVGAADPLGWFRLESVAGTSGPASTVLRLHPDLR